jgi:TolB-like protein
LQPHRQLLVDGRRLPLGRRALDILSVLAEASGEIVTKDEILETVWPGVIVEENAIQVHVAALRKALGDEAHRLTTVRGLGYRLDLPEQPVSSLEERKKQHSVAVLPFANLTGDRDKDHICDGIVRELVALLSRDGGLKVPSWQSTFVYRDRLADVRTIARQLGVETVVEGWVKAGAQRLRVGAELIDAANGFHLWSGQFDVSLDEIFGLDNGLAHTIADALHVQLAAPRPRTGNPEALDQFLQGMTIATKWSTPETLDEALSHFRKAIDLDAKFAKAIAEWAHACSLKVMLGFERPEALADARRMAERALALEPTLIEGHTVLSCIGLQTGEWQLAEDHSGLGDICPMRGMFCAMVGHLDMARSYREAALANNPVNASAMVTAGLLSWIEGDLDKAVERMMLGVAQRYPPHEMPVTLVMAEAAFAAGDIDAAADNVAAGYSQAGMADEAADVFRRVYAALAGQGSRELALAALQRFAGSRPMRSSGLLMLFLTRLGDVEGAYEVANAMLANWKRDGVLEHPGVVCFWPAEMEPFRADRRFFGLCQELGFIDYWRRYGMPLSLKDHPLAGEFVGRSIAAA